MQQEALQKLASSIAKANQAGIAAANACAEDGGSANLDRVVLCGLPRMREEKLRSAGINCRKAGPGSFYLGVPFGGQGDRRYAGVQAVANSLKADGVDCYIHYQMD